MRLVKLNEADLELGRSSLGDMVDGEAVAYGDLLLTYP